MQFTCIHHFTVDEHLIRSVAVLAEIEQGKVEDLHPLTVKAHAADRGAHGAFRGRAAA